MRKQQNNNDNIWLIYNLNCFNIDALGTTDAGAQYVPKQCLFQSFFTISQGVGLWMDAPV